MIYKARIINHGAVGSQHVGDLTVTLESGSELTIKLFNNPPVLSFFKTSNKPTLGALRR